VAPRALLKQAHGFQRLSLGMEIRRLQEGDAREFRELRRRALTSVPEAFAESLEEHLKTPLDVFAERFRGGGDENFVLGAFADGALAGTIGFYRDLRQKRRHRGWIWGMFVEPSLRGQGAGRQLLREAIARAGRIEGLRCVMLSVAATQTAARHLYTSEGFQPYGLEPEALQVNARFIDEEHMRLRL
jgi:RimJ/RimL family protein N-acetyltransferase